MYILRSKDGVVKAKLSNRVAGEVINELYGGAWVEKDFVDVGKCSVFVIGSNGVYGNPNNMMLYFFADDYLRKE